MIRNLRNMNDYEKANTLFPCLQYLNEYLKKLVELLRKEHFKDSLFTIVNDKFDKIYYNIYEHHENDFIIQNSFLMYDILYCEFLA